MSETQKNWAVYLTLSLGIIAEILFHTWWFRPAESTTNVVGIIAHVIFGLMIIAGYIIIQAKSSTTANHHIDLFGLLGLVIILAGWTGYLASWTGNVNEIKPVVVKTFVDGTPKVSVTADGIEYENPAGTDVTWYINMKLDPTAAPKGTLKTDVKEGEVYFKDASGKSSLAMPFLRK